MGMMAIRLRVSILVVAVIGACFAQNPEAGGHTKKFAIAQLLNARFLAVFLDGKVVPATLPRDLYFTVSVFSPDGRRMAGYANGGFDVIDQGLRTIWSRPERGENVISLALSSDGAKLGVALASSGAKRWTDKTWRLQVMESSGSERDLGAFSYNTRPEEPVTLTWDPVGRRLAFNDEGEIRVLDTERGESRLVGRGLDPTWSPDGRWIAYRTAAEQIALIDMHSGQIAARRLGAKVISFAHWSPDSSSIFVDEDKGRSRECPSDSQFVVYEIATGKSHEVYDPCGLRDWTFGWIAEPEVWINAAMSSGAADVR